MSVELLSRTTCKETYFRIKQEAVVAHTRAAVVLLGKSLSCMKFHAGKNAQFLSALQPAMLLAMAFSKQIPEASAFLLPELENYRYNDL